jgi:ankyrin repeat protein
VKNKLELQFAQVIDANDLDSLKILLADENLNLLDLKFSRNDACIHYAARKGRLEVVKLLLKKDPNLAA